MQEISVSRLASSVCFTQNSRKCCIMQGWQHSVQGKWGWALGRQNKCSVRWRHFIKYTLCIHNTCMPRSNVLAWHSLYCGIELSKNWQGKCRICNIKSMSKMPISSKGLRFSKNIYESLWYCLNLCFIELFCKCSHLWHLVGTRSLPTYPHQTRPGIGSPIPYIYKRYN